MATTIGQRVVTQQRANQWVAAIAAGAAALVLAGAAGLAVFISQAPVANSGGEARAISQVQHAAGRGFQADLGSYTISMVARTSQATGYAAGKGGLMENPGLERPAAEAPAASQPRGGILESADVR
jgi:hypothetical protein